MPPESIQISVPGALTPFPPPRKSDHQHYPPLSLDESVRIAHHNGIHLRQSHRLTILTDVQPTLVDDLRDLLSPQPTTSLGKYIKYGLLDLHDSKTFQKLFGKVTFTSRDASLKSGAISSALHPAIPHPIGVTRNVSSG